MSYNYQIINYLQANKILALKLDHAVSDVREQVSNQISTLTKVATRLVYYTSYFTDKYQDVCQKKRIEDTRFKSSLFYLLIHNNIACDILDIYFEDIFKRKSSAQLERIKKKLMAMNVHIAAGSLTNTGFAMATAVLVSLGINLKYELSALAEKSAGAVVGAVTVYGVVQRAVDSAQRLQYTYPAYYTALYAKGLEMMYFFIEPLFERTLALRA